MRDITKDIQIMINGSPEVFRLMKAGLVFLSGDPAAPMISCLHSSDVF